MFALTPCMVLGRGKRHAAVAEWPDQRLVRHAFDNRPDASLLAFATGQGPLKGREEAEA